jgi:hypothetical protein
MDDLKREKWRIEGKFNSHDRFRLLKHLVATPSFIPLERERERARSTKVEN